MSTSANTTSGLHPQAHHPHSAPEPDPRASKPLSWELGSTHQTYLPNNTDGFSPVLRLHGASITLTDYVKAAGTSPGLELHVDGRTVPFEPGQYISKWGCHEFVATAELSGDSNVQIVKPAQGEKPAGVIQHVEVTKEKTV